MEKVSILVIQPLYYRKELVQSYHFQNLNLNLNLYEKKLYLSFLVVLFVTWVIQKITLRILSNLTKHYTMHSMKKTREYLGSFSPERKKIPFILHQ